MKHPTQLLAGLTALTLLTAPSLPGADLTEGMSVGNPGLKSIGPLAFGPGDILFAADTKAAAVFAIATEEAGRKRPANLKIDKLDDKIAALLGTAADQILVNDLAVHPTSGTPYLAVSRGRGPDAQPVLLRAKPDGSLELVTLDKVKFSRVALPDPPQDAESGEGRRRRNPRLESITDIGYSDGNVIVAGLSNEEFASSFRSIPFPFKNATKGTTVEIYHGAHGKLETRSPVRTFVPFTIDDEPHLLAAYTCTPLVQFPLRKIEPGAKIRGLTIAELGNRNRPLDMIVYKKGDDRFLLIANSARGIMKVSTADIGDVKGIENRVASGQTEGLSYETVETLKGVEQLALYDEKTAIVVQRGESTGLTLVTLPLP